jgi:hypothetical protein
MSVSVDSGPNIPFRKDLYLYEICVTAVTGLYPKFLIILDGSA